MSDKIQMEIVMRDDDIRTTRVGETKDSPKREENDRSPDILHWFFANTVYCPSHPQWVVRLEQNDLMTDTGASPLLAM